MIKILIVNTCKHNYNIHIQAVSFRFSFEIPERFNKMIVHAAKIRTKMESFAGYQ